MFLHLGKNTVIPLKDIIAIIDAQSSFQSKDTRDFIKICMEEGFVENISDDKVETYIITESVQKDKSTGEEIRKSKIYSSHISSTTLFKRAEFIENI
ncbi:extracellular matrix regulator RemB [Clostridiisalibacter paucivorans]|uniref:extracellular matrix regulator RemB n=1 Tax=Clostridiisalibacter paucivorans TaxID=408753 RepID=UPI00047E699D|nr:extracellular matrix/biofilm biosynthesis regulator RemA family protein [Clostridiisalibacter paucivorans]